jgi:23S rRNA (uracil1939-C5)-methyltransferase
LGTAIAAPVLRRCAEALERATAADRAAAEWMHATAEVEISCDGEEEKVQVHLLCPRPAPARKGSLERMAQHVAAADVPLASIGASRLHVASGRALETLATWGPDGVAYRVREHSFWLKRGSFFQINRFMVPVLVDLVCQQRSGSLAWDLFAGVGLFARTLAQRFAQVTAVEANPLAVQELRRGLRRPGDTALQDTTLAFLRKAVLQRDRPELIVLDPPRAGAGEDVCALLLRLAPAEIVYVSCDPTTLARDLAVLAAGYDVAELHMVDLFPQTYHLETVMVLRRRAVQG